MNKKLETISDFQDDILANSKRWFPKKVENNDSIILNDVLGIVGEAGEIADVYKKWHRGSMSINDTTDRLIEESIDLMHYLFELWLMLGVDVEAEYRKKTEFNEKRFGSKAD